MHFSEKLKHYQTIFENGILEYCLSSKERPARLHEAMRYSLDAGGKRLRPVLLLAASELKSSKENPVPAAVAIECVHTYSLIHDDLPCMDNSPLRRGKPSCHAAYDEATALLAGDGLLTFAFELLYENYRHAPLLALDLIGDLSHAAGSRKLIGGQMEDLLAENKFTPMFSSNNVDIEYIHLNKTSAMIACALVMGSRLAGLAPNEIELYREIGLSLGNAFQIVDDILDETGTEKELGKTTGTDAKNNKITYTKLHGLEAARAAVKRYSLQAKHLCEEIGGNNMFILQIIDYLENRTH